MSQFIFVARVYMPSFLARYFVQLMTILLPLITLERGASFKELSFALGTFYVGSIASGLLFSTIVHRARPTVATVLGILALALFSALCLVVENTTLLAISRLLQGAASGVLRPAVQVWLIEAFEHAQDAASKKLRSIYSQVGMALGMSAGSLVGSSYHRLHGLDGVIVGGVLVPAVLCLLLFPYRVSPASRGTTNIASTAPSMSHSNGALKDERWTLWGALVWLFRTPRAGIPMAHFLVSMIALKVWIVGGIVAIRGQFPLNDSLHRDLLALTLTVQPLVFALTQFIVGRLYAKRSFGQRRLFVFLCLGNLGQMILCWLAAGSTSPLVSCALILGGGSFFAGLIYPAMSSLLLDCIHTEPLNLQRQVMLLLSLSADVGLVIGSAVLGFKTNMGIPLEAMAVPVAAFVCLVAFSVASHLKNLFKGLRSPVP